MARSSQRPLKKRWNYVGPEALNDRPRMAMTWINGIDTLETYRMKQAMKHHQCVAVRDMQNYSEARLIEVRHDGAAVLETYNETRREITTWLIDTNGKRTLEGARPG